MRVVVSIILVLITTSCLKKIEGVDELNTNIFDKEYAGGCWFEIEDTYWFINDFGLPRMRVKAVLPDENVPDLSPNLIYIKCRVNNQPEILFNAFTDSKGDYKFYYDAVIESSNNYCLQAGLYIQDEDTTINTFTLCSQP